ncbi:WapI family immunity protein [Aeromicrobium duanguangcaii]|uniref:Uncharacterized protein n=1 Tax=Aeromicrobium duanguangcaii TaxID=2968086 RepID=A0ABY5KB35_9ACTN|nr:hypothetical protein [Aeromicrobium duanguangcaii]MCD9154948.1 hypothetical protein [Aeromicrobium duanguangcaii]UUI67647.1 hypothetical protein NP095_10575 [Aeromicrobium duanguangcaii]
MTGDVLDLSIAGYEFDATTLGADAEWDANWLVVAGEVTTAGETWTFRNPCLTTWEARELLEFLREAKVDASVEFTEPNLSFHVTEATDDTVTVGACLRAEAAAATATHDVRWGSGTSVWFRVSRGGLDEAATAWAAELECFPQR